MDCDRRDNAAGREVLGRSTDISVIPQSSPIYQPPTITVSSAEKGILCQEQTQRDPHETEPEAVEKIHGIWIFIAMATTFVLMSFIPIMLFDVLTAPAIALHLTQFSTTSGIVVRSFELETRSWNYTKLCEPRVGQCQFGTYNTKSAKKRELLWLDEDCMKMDYFSVCPRCPKEETLVLSSVPTEGVAFFPWPLLVKFHDPGNYTDIPSIFYYDTEYCRNHNEVGSWFGPGSDDEFFSLLWFDCFAGLDGK